MLNDLFTSNSKRLPYGALGALVLFIILVISIRVTGWSFKYAPDKTMKNVLPQLYESKHYDIVALGSSHIGEMKFNTNLQRVSRVLNKDIAVLGKAGQGVIPMTLFLDTFFYYGNDAGTILVFLDSFLFSHYTSNEGTACIQNEPLDLYFTKRLFELGFEFPAIMSHFAYNVNIKHLYTPIAKAGKEPIHHIATFKEKRWLKRAEIYDLDNQEYVIKKLIQFNALVERYSDKKWVLVMPPLNFPRHMVEENLKIFKKLFSEYVDTSNLTIVDYSFLIEDPKYFMDMDHLNSPGWEHFAEIGLKPIFAD